LFPHFFDVSERGEFLTCDLFDKQAMAIAFFSEPTHCHAAVWKRDLRCDFQPQRSIRSNVS
jgi:hypothetical protein